MRKTSSHVKTFKATDEYGGEHTLHVYQEFVHPAGSVAIPGFREIRTAGGLHVNRIDKGKYHVVEADVSLTSADPNAE